MTDNPIVRGLPQTYAELAQTAPDFSNYLGIYTEGSKNLAVSMRGPIQRGQVKLTEFSQHYLKQHPAKPGEVVHRKTPQGELTLRFDSNGLPTSADCASFDHKAHEHVTVDKTGKIIADDIYSGNFRTSHIAYDGAHHLVEASADRTRNRHEVEQSLSFRWDSSGNLTYAHERKSDGTVIDLYNEPSSKRIVTSNAKEGPDVDTYKYDPKSNAIIELDLDTGHGQEFHLTPKPDGTLDFKGPFTHT